jgi:uncharacterized protein
MDATIRQEREVPTRRISFDDALRDMPRDFCVEGDLIMAHLVASLSAMFPDGEDFFVESVRAYRSEITDPELRRQVNGFIGQEAMHGRVHRALNDRLDELGYRTRRVERRTRSILKLHRKTSGRKRRLAITAALEHFTATLAEHVLRNPETREMFSHPTARQVFLWHALEESEHKAVAFDVYRAIGGSEKLRIRVMKQIRTGFVINTALQVAVAVLTDERSRQRGVLRQSWQRFRRSPLWDRALWAQLRDYDRPDFHPDDSDTNALVAEWREHLFGAGGELTDKLPPAAA